MYILLNLKYKSKDVLVGICGNFNGRYWDDLMMLDKNMDVVDDIVFVYVWWDE